MISEERHIHVFVKVFTSEPPYDSITFEKRQKCIPPKMSNSCQNHPRWVNSSTSQRKILVCSGVNFSNFKDYDTAMRRSEQEPVIFLILYANFSCLFQRIFG